MSFCFGFAGGIWVLIASVPGHCILVSFNMLSAILIYIVQLHSFVAMFTAQFLFNNYSMSTIFSREKYIYIY